MKKYTNLLLLVLLFTPVVVSAQLTGIGQLITATGSLVNPLIAILIGLALVAFFWGLAKFIFRIGGDEKAVEEGKKLMIWGLIALFVMVSVWGIIGFAQRELNLNIRGGSTQPNPPNCLDPFAPCNNVPT